MFVLRHPDSVSRIPDPVIRDLVRLRFEQICAGEPHDIDRHGYMAVVEPGDTAEALERVIGWPILRDPFDDVRFGDPDFAPSFEALEEHASCYEIVFILTDESGVAIFVPKIAGVDAELLATCARYAQPAPEPAQP